MVLMLYSLFKLCWITVAASQTSAQDENLKVRKKCIFTNFVALFATIEQFFVSKPDTKQRMQISRLFLINVSLFFKTICIAIGAIINVYTSEENSGNVLFRHVWCTHGDG